MSKPFAELYDKKFIRSANAIYDDAFRQDLISDDGILKWLRDEYSELDRQEEFLSFYPDWIRSSKNNTISGLESFPHRHISLGCTQSLDAFHYRTMARGQRLRMFRGEYPYNRDVCKFDWNTGFIDDFPLERGDAVIISAPFSATGDVHPRWQELLTTCNELDIPVAVDCAFFGTCSNIRIDLDHPAIETVVFSTTKGLGCGLYRSGIEFSKINDSHLAVQTEWHHGIHLNVAIGLFLMKKYSPDYIFEKYRPDQLAICEEYGLTPTNTVHLALGDESWDYFSRDGYVNRIGIKNAVKDRRRDLKKLDK